MAYQPPTRAEFQEAIQRAKTECHDQWKLDYLESLRITQEEKRKHAVAFLAEHYTLDDHCRMVDGVYVKTVPMPFSSETHMDELVASINHVLAPHDQRAWFDRCNGQPWTVEHGCSDCRYDVWQARDDTQCMFKVKLH